MAAAAAAAASMGGGVARSRPNDAPPLSDGPGRRGSARPRAARRWESISDPSRLQIGWLKENGTIVPQKSQVDTKFQVVYGYLQHFSMYGVIQPEW